MKNRRQSQKSMISKTLERKLVRDVSANRRTIAKKSMNKVRRKGLKWILFKLKHVFWSRFLRISMPLYLVEMMALECIVEKIRNQWSQCEELFYSHGCYFVVDQYLKQLHYFLTVIYYNGSSIFQKGSYCYICIQLKSCFQFYILQF